MGFWDSFSSQHWHNGVFNQMRVPLLRTNYCILLYLLYLYVLCAVQCTIALACPTGVSFLIRPTANSWNMAVKSPLKYEEEGEGKKDPVWRSEPSQGRKKERDMWAGHGRFQICVLYPSCSGDGEVSCSCLCRQVTKCSFAKYTQ